MGGSQRYQRSLVSPRPESARGALQSAPLADSGRGETKTCELYAASGRGLLDLRLVASGHRGVLLLLQLHLGGHAANLDVQVAFQLQRLLRLLQPALLDVEEHRPLGVLALQVGRLDAERQPL